MDTNSEFKIGQLVEYRAWYDGEGAWISIENQIGIVLEVIAIKDVGFNHLGDDIVVYDIRVYWVFDGEIETVPDLLLVEYGYESMNLK